MFKLDLQSRKPIYEQLKDKLSELVMLGQLGADDQLPSVRNLARDIGVNPNTVQKAYQELEREGLIYSVTGRGSYINQNADIANVFREKQLGALKKAAVQAKSGGVEEHQALDAVKSVYREERSSDDQGN